MECKIEYIKDILGILAILIGGAWTFWRFVLQREKHPKVQFDVDLRLIGTQKDSHLVEVISIIENKGLVRHYIKDFAFDLFYLTDNDGFEEGGKEINNQIKFKKIIDKRPWIKKDEWDYTFVDAGVKQKYAYATSLPTEAAFVLLIANFKYTSEKGDFHTSQKIFNLKLLQKEFE